MEIFVHEYKYTLGVNIRKPGQKSNSFGTCAQYKFGGSSMSDYCAILDITSQTVNGQVKTIVRTYGHSLGYTAQDCKSPTNPKVIERGLQLTL
jgi:hypothetical protein